MSVRVRLFYPALEREIAAPGDLRLEGSTVGECLDDLIRRYPGTGRLLFDSRKALLKPVYVYVNSESLFKADMAKPVTERDELIVAVLAAGG
jgi:molybdopterin converting factor small subunit